MNVATMNSHLNQGHPIRPPPRHGNPMKPKCWLIGSSAGSGLPSAAARSARLRGLEVGFLPIDEVASTSIVGAKNQVIALNFEALEAVGANGRQRLKTWAEKGATIYVRGSLHQGSFYSLE